MRDNYQLSTLRLAAKPTKHGGVSQKREFHEMHMSSAVPGSTKSLTDNRTDETDRRTDSGEVTPKCQPSHARFI